MQTDPAANFNLKPGEIRVYGLGTLAQSSNSSSPNGTFGYILQFTKIGDQVGQSQWQYVGTDKTIVNPKSSTTKWQGNVPDTADVSVSVTAGSNFSTNNGLIKESNGPGVWPNTTTGNVIGRFFNIAVNEPATTTDLGPISGMASALPNPSAATAFGYFVVRAKGLTQSEAGNCVATGATNFLE